MKKNNKSQTEEQIPSADTIIDNAVKEDQKALNPNLTVFGKTVLIKEFTEDVMIKKNELLLPPSARDSKGKLVSCPLGIVVKVSKDSDHVSYLQTGDTVMFRPNAGDYIRHNGVDYIRIYDLDLVCKIEEK